VDHTCVHALYEEGKGVAIPIKAMVQCSDGPGGRSTYVVVNPITEQVTHIVVREKQAPHLERLVPAMFVKATTSDRIQLTCSRSQLEQMRPFVETEYVRVEASLLKLANLSSHDDEDVMSLPYTRMELPQTIQDVPRRTGHASRGSRASCRWARGASGRVCGRLGG
jgi:hypothetical protein